MQVPPCQSQSGKKEEGVTGRTGSYAATNPRKDGHSRNDKRDRRCEPPPQKGSRHTQCATENIVHEIRTMLAVNTCRTCKAAEDRTEGKDGKQSCAGGQGHATKAKTSDKLLPPQVQTHTGKKGENTQQCTHTAVTCEQHASHYPAQAQQSTPRKADV